mmetsp:Transcript_6020/g.12393  ORF Transcript_6020/g.12393 Transcript_6020/m.12393 type:complete len:360 (-) Transcript_6020:938-2017(-)
MHVGDGHLGLLEVFPNAVEKVLLLGSWAGIPQQDHRAVVALEAIQGSADKDGHLFIPERLNLGALCDVSRNQVKSKKQDSVVQFGENVGVALGAIKFACALGSVKAHGLFKGIVGGKGVEPSGKGGHLIGTANPIVFSGDNINGNRRSIQQTGNLGESCGRAHARGRVLQVTEMGHKLGIAGNIGQIRGNLLLTVSVTKGSVGGNVKGNIHVNISVLPQILVLPPPRGLGNGDKNGGKGNHQTQDGTKNLAATLLLHGNLLPGLVLLASANAHIIAFIMKFIILPDCAQVGKTSGSWLHALGLRVVLEGEPLLEGTRLVLGISHAARNLVGNPTHLVARLAGGSHEHVLGTRSRRLGRL